MSVKTIHKTKPRGLLFMSFLVALFADMKCVNWGLVKGGFSDEGILGLLYITTVGLIFLSSLLFNTKNLHNFIKYPTFLAAFLVFFYFFTSSLYGTPSVPLGLFLVFTISSLLIPQIAKVDAKLFTLFVIAIPSFSILRVDQIFASYLDWSNQISMDASYGYLVPIVANIVYLFLFFREDQWYIKVLIIILSVINTVFLIQLLLFGSRGPLLALFLLFLFLWIVKIKDTGGVFFIKKRVCVTFILLILVFFLFMPLVSLINKLLLEREISLYAIEKIIDLKSEGDITNGRADLVKISINGFFDSPLWGNGIGQFEKKSHSGLEYPHNFILQILYDGGIILFSLVLLPVIRKTIKCLRNCDINSFTVFSVLFFASVPGALLSQDLWDIPVLWLFFGFILSSSFVPKYV